MHAKSIGGILAWLALTMPLIAQAPADRASLAGTAWRLVKFEGGDGKVMRPPTPDGFTLEFQQGDALAASMSTNP